MTDFTKVDRDFNERFIKGQDRVPYYVLATDAKSFLHEKLEEAVREEGERIKKEIEDLECPKLSNKSI